MEEIVAEALNLYSADRVGRFDFALEKSGGSVMLDRCSPSFDHAVTSVSLLGILPLWHVPSTPKVIIQVLPSLEIKLLNTPWSLLNIYGTTI